MFGWLKRLFARRDGGNGHGLAALVLHDTTPTPEQLARVVRPEDTVALLKRDITSRRRDITEKLKVLREAVDDQAGDASGSTS